MRIRTITVMVLVMATVGAASARTVADKERLRQQASQICYDDVQRICADQVPDEAAIAVCMKTNRGQLTPACRKAFDAGNR